MLETKFSIRSASENLYRKNNTGLRVLQAREIEQAAGGSANHIWASVGLNELASQFYPGALDVRSGPISRGGMLDSNLLP